MYNELKIDYAIISNNQNPEYKDIFPYIQKRWNQLGIKTIYIDCFESSPVETFIDIRNKDNGNIEIRYDYPSLGHDRLLDRWFEIMIARFYIAAKLEFLRDKVLVISDGDLLPINRKAVFCPSIQLSGGNFSNIINDGGIVTTCMYPFGESLATYTYGLGETFHKLLPFLSIYDLYKDAETFVHKSARMYCNDEYYMNHRYRITSEVTLYALRNRKWIEGMQQMNNLYYYQIPLLMSWVDLCPFVEFHGMRKSVMDNYMWDRLFKLLEEYDKYDITPNNYFYESIKTEDLWRDTMITKQGLLIPGDEYDGELKLKY